MIPAKASAFQSSGSQSICLMILTIVIILISTVISPTIIWNSIDKFIVILALINTIALILLRNDVLNE